MIKNFYKTFIPYHNSLNLFREYFHQKDSGQARLSRLTLLFFLLLTSYFLLFSCSFLTHPDKTTVSGVVKLEGQTNHIGVKVSLCYLVDLDTTLTRINKQYPNIGIQISQETEFYHREQTQVYTTNTTNTANRK